MLLRSLTRSVVAAGLLISPGLLRAQIGASTACRDGTVARTGGVAACNSHGGVDERHTASVRSVERAQRGAVAGRAGVATARTTSSSGAASTGMRSSTSLPLPRIGSRPARPGDRTPPAASPEISPSGRSGRLCKDGTVVHGNGREGNCGGHGGVAPHGTNGSSRYRRDAIRERHTARRDRRDDDHGDTDRGKGHGKGRGKRD